MFHTDDSRMMNSNDLGDHLFNLFTGHEHYAITIVNIMQNENHDAPNAGVSHK